MKLTKTLNLLRKEALVRLSGVTKVFCSDYETEEFYELPIYFRVTKHGYYEEYAVVSIDKNNLTCIAKGETNEQEITVDINEIETVNLCYLAELVN